MSLPSPPTSSSSAAAYASSACTACKSKTRKCDKALPSCGLCARTGSSCTYRRHNDSDSNSPARPASHLDASAFQGEQHVQNETLHAAAVRRLREPHHASPFSAAFLDIDAFRRLNLQLPKPTIGIPMASWTPSTSCCLRLLPVLTRGVRMCLRSSIVDILLSMPLSSTSARSIGGSLSSLRRD